MQSNPYQPPGASESTSDDDSERDIPSVQRPTLPISEDATPHDFDDIQFVRQAIALASRDPELSSDGNASAAAICRVLLEVAVDLYGQGGRELLVEWNLARSEVIGSIVRRLVAAGLETRVANEPENAYDALFDLTKPPETWALKWTDT